MLGRQGKEKTKDKLLNSGHDIRLFNKQIYVTTTVNVGGKQMAEDKLFTQEEVNKLVGQARLEGKEIGRKEFEGYISQDDFTKKTADLNTQLSGLNDQIKTLTDEKTALETQLSEKAGLIAKYETDSVKTKVARELGLTYEAAEFLQGDTEEAIRKSGEALKGIVSKSFTPPAFNSDPAPGGDEKANAWGQMSRDLTNR